MPQRVYAIGIGVLGLLGLGVVAWLVLRGRDVRAASTTGPRWRRTLVTAALALLAAVGVTVPMACTTCYVPARPDPEKIDSQSFRQQMDDLRKRTDLLEQQFQHQGQTLSPEALQVALAGAEVKLGDIEGQWAAKSMTDDQHAAFRAEIDETRKRLHQLHAEAQAAAAERAMPPWYEDPGPRRDTVDNCYAILASADESMDALRQVQDDALVDEEARSEASEWQSRLERRSATIAGNGQLAPVFTCYLVASSSARRAQVLEEAVRLYRRAQLLARIRDGRELDPDVVDSAVKHAESFAGWLEASRKEEHLSDADRRAIDEAIAAARRELARIRPTTGSAATQPGESGGGE